jgi:hypothetical protein
MEHSRTENRIFERHSIQKPVFLLATGHNLPSHILMDNLCGGGVLIHTSAEIPLGESVEMLVELSFPQKWFGVKQVQVLVKGKVIRRDGPCKVAVRFDDPEIIGSVSDN